MSAKIWLTSYEGEDVAILPRSDSPASEVLDIQTISTAGLVYFILADGQMFKRIGGELLDGCTFIVPATEQHRAALGARESSPAEFLGRTFSLWANVTL